MREIRTTCAHATPSCRCAQEYHEDGADAAEDAIKALITAYIEEWRNRVPDEKPDWHEAATEIWDAIERGEHRG